MNPPLISVITPTFNSGAKIAATVASVLAQRKELYEFLVIDGGSTDDTRRLPHAPITLPRDFKFGLAPQLLAPALLSRKLWRCFR